jgi:hypothetical protein
MPVYLQLQLAASWADLETVLKSKLRAYTTGKVQITLQKLSGSSGRVQLELGASGEISTTITASAALAYAPSSGELSLSDIKIAAPAENIGSAIDVPVLEGALAARLTLQLDALMGQHLTNLGGGLLSLAGARADSVSATAASLEAHYTVPAPPLLIQP